MNMGRFRGGYMNNKIMILLTVFLSLCLLKLDVYAREVTPVKGDLFPTISLAMPERADAREYLGLTGDGSFSLSQIKADVLIVEIFSMYCPYCQKEAPLVNDLYRIISEKPALKDRIKIIGIGAGNTPFEVDVFRDKYDIRFPLFSDESFTVHKAVGEVRTPCFFVLRTNADRPGTVVYSKVGTIQDPNLFLDLIVKEAGLQKETDK
jgi:peroxiredoxin